MPTQLFRPGFDARRNKEKDTILHFTIYDICLATSLTYDEIVSKRGNKKFKTRDIISVANFIVDENEKFPFKVLPALERNSLRYKSLQCKRKIKVSCKNIASYLDMTLVEFRNKIKEQKINTNDILRLSHFIVKYKKSLGH